MRQIEWSNIESKIKKDSVVKFSDRLDTQENRIYELTKGSTLHIWKWQNISSSAIWLSYISKWKHLEIKETKIKQPWVMYNTDTQSTIHRTRLCVCVCVCVWERERERWRQRQRFNKLCIGFFFVIFSISCLFLRIFLLNYLCSCGIWDRLVSM